jgi:sRNA-binding regulator protein Hfq
VRLTDGEAIRGILRAHDTYALIIDRGDAAVLPELVYKHGISFVSMAPSGLAVEGITDE